MCFASDECINVRSQSQSLSHHVIQFRRPLIKYLSRHFTQTEPRGEESEENQRYFSAFHTIVCLLSEKHGIHLLCPTVMRTCEN